MTVFCEKCFFYYIHFSPLEKKTWTASQSGYEIRQIIVKNNFSITLTFSTKHHEIMHSVAKNKNLSFYPKHNSLDRTLVEDQDQQLSHWLYQITNGSSVLWMVLSWKWSSFELHHLIPMIGSQQNLFVMEHITRHAKLSFLNHVLQE